MKKTLLSFHCNRRWILRGYSLTQFVNSMLIMLLFCGLGKCPSKGHYFAYTMRGENTCFGNEEAQSCWRKRISYWQCYTSRTSSDQIINLCIFLRPNQRSKFVNDLNDNGLHIFTSLMSFPSPPPNYLHILSKIKLEAIRWPNPVMPVRGIVSTATTTEQTLKDG